MDMSFRSQLVAKRTYCRPGEAWGDVVNRVINHQQWLWERAKGEKLDVNEQGELAELHELMEARVALPSGRILWMGGTEQAAKTEISMFNCSFAEVRDVYTAVDAYYLLLNGCGVGFKPVSGLLNGFAAPVSVEVVRSERRDKGNPDNHDRFYDRFEAGEGYVKTWHLTVGDSGIAWGKALGKILAMKRRVDRIILDFTEIRPAGEALGGYGWLSSGDTKIADAFEKIVKILSNAHDRILTEIEILDIMNLAGTTLTSRRSAQIAMLHAHHQLAEEFADAKRDHYKNGVPWRSQSNNTLVFWRQPNKLELRGLFQRMLDAGGSEPGLYNGVAASRRAPWFTGTNPCGEILLPDGGLCNLVEVDLGKLVGLDKRTQEEVFELIARANYRQTCVNLKDGVLSDKWHETQEFLRLCGVGITGIVTYEAAVPQEKFVDDLQDFRMAALRGSVGMADELDLPRPKATTTVKPSGTLGKLMDTTEGLHKPLGRYVINAISFSKYDPLVARLHAAGYAIQEHPYNGEEVLIDVPVDNGEGVPLYNTEPAVVQLDRYLTVMKNYVDHNASVTISYDPHEIPEIVDWLHENWDDYVGVSFILRTDPTKTAEDLGYPYLPQTVVDAETFNSYVSQLKDVDVIGSEQLDFGECEGGACPVR